MKILYSCLSKSWGGMEMFTITAVKQLLKRGIHVDLLCLEESRIHIESNNLGILIHPVKASGYFHPFTILRTSVLIKRGNYDIIHTQASKDLWLLVPSLKLHGSKTPLILTKQVGSFIVKKDFLHRWLYKRLTYALAISNVISRNLKETCPIAPEKIILLHNGIDLRRFDPSKSDPLKVRNEFKIGAEEILIGMLARFSPGKGHEDFLYAAKELNCKFSNLRFLIVGEASRGEDEYAARIKQLAVKYKLNNLIFTGFRSDTPDVLSALDIFVFPSHAEAFGIALAEAIAMGKPSVCSNSDGILDIAVDNETSLLFDNKDPVDLSNKLEKLIQSAELRSRFGAAAIKRAGQLFDIEKLTDRVIEIYGKALKEKR